MTEDRRHGQAGAGETVVAVDEIVGRARTEHLDVVDGAGLVDRAHHRPERRAVGDDREGEAPDAQPVEEGSPVSTA